MPIRSILLTAALLIGVQCVTAEQQGGGAPRQEPSAVITGAVIEGISEPEIRSSWKQDLDAYRERRKQYLLIRSRASMQHLTSDQA